MVPKDKISAHDWAGITKITKKAVELMLGMTFIALEERDGRTYSIMQTTNLERAVYHLKRRGVSFEAWSDGDKEAIAPGAALHLVML